MTQQISANYRMSCRACHTRKHTMVMLHWLICHDGKVTVMTFVNTFQKLTTSHMDKDCTKSRPVLNVTLYFVAQNIVV